MKTHDGKKIDPEIGKRIWSRVWRRINDRRIQEENERRDLILAMLKPDEKEMVKAVVLRHPEGRSMIVSRCPIHNEKWRLTWFTMLGIPWGHAVFDSFEDAVLSGCGFYRNGPPHGDRQFTVAEVKMKTRKE